MATPNAQAWRSSIASGVGVTDVAPTTTCSANAPTITVPNTRSPAATVSTPSPTASTTPANSLPGTNGAGTLIWYSFAQISTSGKFTDAARTATRT